MRDWAPGHDTGFDLNCQIVHLGGSRCPACISTSSLTDYAAFTGRPLVTEFTNKFTNRLYPQNLLFRYLFHSVRLRYNELIINL